MFSSKTRHLKDRSVSPQSLRWCNDLICGRIFVLSGTDCGSEEDFFSLLCLIEATEQKKWLMDQNIDFSWTGFHHHYHAQRVTVNSRAVHWEDSAATSLRDWTPTGTMKRWRNWSCWSIIELLKFNFLLWSHYVTANVAVLTCCRDVAVILFLQLQIWLQGSLEAAANEKTTFLFITSEHSLPINLHTHYPFTHKPVIKGQIQTHFSYHFALVICFLLDLILCVQDCWGDNISLCAVKPRR